MWNTSIVNEGCQDSVASLLVASLRSVLSEAEILQDVRCEHPIIEPGSENHEIVEQLERFRMQVKEIERREAVIIAGVSRARRWAQSLRRMAPGLRPEIDSFWLATSQCSALQECWLPNPYNLFNGGKRLQNYLDRRFHRAKWGDDGESGVDYEVCGKVAVSDIVFACETLLARLETQYEMIENLEENLVSGSLGQHLVLDLAEAEEIEADAGPEKAQEGLDEEQTAEGIETLLGLEARAEETMRLAKAVQARVGVAQETAVGKTDVESAARPAEDADAKREGGGKAPAGRFNLFDEIMLPMDADDFFAGVPGVDLGHA
jgi:hypothetical protein